MPDLLNIFHEFLKKIVSQYILLAIVGINNINIIADETGGYVLL